MSMKLIECTRCDGRGKIALFTSIEDPCKECKGSGKVPCPEESDIPKGKGTFLDESEPLTRLINSYSLNHYPLYSMGGHTQNIRYEEFRDGFKKAHNAITHYNVDSEVPSIQYILFNRKLFGEIAQKGTKFSINVLTDNWNLWGSWVHINSLVPENHCYLVSEPVILEEAPSKCYLVYRILSP